MSSTAIEDMLRKEVARITAERDAIRDERDQITAVCDTVIKANLSLSESERFLRKREDFILKEAMKLDETIPNAGLDRKSRKILRDIFYEFNVKIRSPMEEAQEEGKQHESKFEDLKIQDT